MFVGDHAGDDFAAHAVEFTRWRLQVGFDFTEREGVIGALIPVALAIHGVKIKADRFRTLAPIRTLLVGDPSHQVLDEWPAEWPVLPKPPRELLELELELRPTEGTDVRLVDGENRLRLAEACVVDGVVDRLDQYEER